MNNDSIRDPNNLTLNVITNNTAMTTTTTTAQTIPENGTVSQLLTSGESAPTAVHSNSHLGECTVITESNRLQHRQNQNPPITTSTTFSDPYEQQHNINININPPITTSAVGNMQMAATVSENSLQNNQQNVLANQLLALRSPAMQPSSTTGNMKNNILKSDSNTSIITRNAQSSESVNSQGSNPGGSSNNKSKGGPHRDNTFPFKLYEILEKEEYEHAIVWTPSNKAWKVVNQEEFEKILPHYFKHGCFKSFVRQVYCWDFRKINSGPDAGAYSNEHFVKGRRDLCMRMSRKNSKRTFKHALASNAGIPNQEFQGVLGGGPTSVGGLSASHTHMGAADPILRANVNVNAMSMFGNPLLTQLGAATANSSSAFGGAGTGGSTAVNPLQSLLDGGATLGGLTGLPNSNVNMNMNMNMNGGYADLLALATAQQQQQQAAALQHSNPNPNPNQANTNGGGGGSNLQQLLNGYGNPNSVNDLSSILNGGGASPSNNTNAQPSNATPTNANSNNVNNLYAQLNGTTAAAAQQEAMLVQAAQRRLMLQKQILLQQQLLMEQEQQQQQQQRAAILAQQQQQGGMNMSVQQALQLQQMLAGLQQGPHQQQNLQQQNLNAQGAGLMGGAGAGAGDHGLQDACNIGGGSHQAAQAQAERSFNPDT